MNVPVFRYKITRNTSHLPILSWLIKKGASKRFWEKVDIRFESECWNWQGAKNIVKTYRQAHFKIDRFTTAIAPRCAYALTHHVDPGASLVLHTCDNSLCCNPGHLYLGNQADNNRDTIKRNRCPRRCKSTMIARAIPGEKIENKNDV